MSFNDDWLKNGLPLFHGAKDKSLARKMIDHLGGPAGFRTAQRVLADGSVVTMKLRGGMPPQFTIEAKPRVETVADFIEVDYYMRDYGYNTTDSFCLWMIQTDLLDEQILNITVIDKHDTNPTLNTTLWERDTPISSSDGLSQLKIVRRVKSATVTGQNTTVTVDFDYEPTKTVYSEDHTARTRYGYFFRVTPIRQIAAMVESSPVKLEFKQPGAIDRLSSEGVNPFDSIVTYGCPWHGRLDASGLLTDGGMLHADIVVGATYRHNYTYYLDFGMPVPAAPSAKEAAIGMAWYRDAVLHGWYRYYGTTTTSFNRRWIYRDESGAVHSLLVTISKGSAYFDTSPNFSRRDLYASVRETITFANGTTSTYTHVSSATCRDYGSEFIYLTTQYYPSSLYTQSVPPASAEYLVNRCTSYCASGGVFDGKADLIFSPDGKKCCVLYSMDETYGTSCRPNAAIEFTASGGNGELGYDGLITVEWRALTELETIYSVHVAKSGLEEIPLNITPWVPSTTSISSWAEMYTRSPAFFSYTKNNELDISVVEMSATESYKRYPEEALPFGGILVRMSSRNHTFTCCGETTTLYHEENRSKYHVRYQAVYVGPSGVSPDCGYFLYNSEDPEQRVSGDPYVGITNYSDENTSSQSQGIYQIVPITDTLTAVERYVSGSNYEVVTAYAYGEKVTQLIGQQLTTTTDVAYNPRTGAVAIGSDVTFI